MNRKKRIESLLLKNFINWKFTVIDNSAQHSGHNNFDGTQETHFCIVIKKILVVLTKKPEEFERKCVVCFLLTRFYTQRLPSKEYRTCH